ncbi:MAG: dephospho-CoA kinase [Corynebacterium sp.]|nr:dephospho-CoA kinase [Corynebacterium sp.]
MLRIGLTGGIGSGKSRVAEYLADQGFYIIDADKVARQIVEPGQPALQDLEEKFGPVILKEGGRLDRQALAAIVFTDEESLTFLNEVTHPRIRQAMEQEIAVAEAGTDAGPYEGIVFDIPLLYENGLKDDPLYKFDYIFVVTAHEETRIQRLVDYRHMNQEDARRRIAAQASESERNSIADFIIDNNGDLEDLRAHIAVVLHNVRDNFRPL